MTSAADSDRKLTAGLGAALDQLWTRFLPETRERISILEAAAAAFAAGKLSDAQRQAAHAAAHKLAGSLGTFSLARGTELAREFEHLTEWDESASPMNADRLIALAREIRSIVDSRK